MPVSGCKVKPTGAWTVWRADVRSIPGKLWQPRSQLGAEWRLPPNRCGLSISTQGFQSGAIMADRRGLPHHEILIRAECESLKVAIDGPVSSGKTTAGSLLARRLGFSFLDTGLMYRAATLAAIGASDERAVAAAVGCARIMVTARPGGSATITLDGQNVDGSLRSPEVDRSVSFVSAIPEVREQLAAEQQRFAETGDVVMVGRDIGTVVLPDAEVKIYLTASAETRARRRHEEHVAASNPSGYDEVLSELRKRDRIDSGRRTSPLRPAEDAHILHTDDMTLEKVVDRMVKLVEAAR